MNLDYATLVATFPYFAYVAFKLYFNKERSFEGLKKKEKEFYNEREVEY